jgi:hypothetical protein
LARSLDSTFLPEIAGIELAPVGARVHPTRLYVMPPLEEPRTGDLVRDGDGNWLVLLTPTCDLIAHNGQRRAVHVVLASCQLLTETDEYRAWKRAGEPNTHSRLERLILNNREGQKDRFYFLPGAWEAPDLLVDLQRLTNVEYTDFEGFTRVATLDDPYAQSLISQLGRYGGRVGTPDLDVAAVKEHLRRTGDEETPENAATAGSAQDGEAKIQRTRAAAPTMALEADEEAESSSLDSEFPD